MILQLEGSVMVKCYGGHKDLVGDEHKKWLV